MGNEKIQEYSGNRTGIINSKIPLEKQRTNNRESLPVKKAPSADTQTPPSPKAHNNRIPISKDQLKNFRQIAKRKANPHQGLDDGIEIKSRSNEEASVKIISFVNEPQIIKNRDQDKIESLTENYAPASPCEILGNGPLPTLASLILLTHVPNTKNICLSAQKAFSNQIKLMQTPTVEAA